jgi:hypothetical protein
MFVPPAPLRSGQSFNFEQPALAVSDVDAVCLRADGNIKNVMYRVLNLLSLSFPGPAALCVLRAVVLLALHPQHECKTASSPVIATWPGKKVR